ncbi:MAG: HAMP domain-containing sensor histidine kinase [Ferruginibacter sp.]
MKFNKLNTIIALGVLAIAGLLVIQLFLLRQAISQEEKKFRQKTSVALMEVVKKIYSSSHLQLPQLNPVKELSEDYYVVNVNQEFNADVLEFYLKSELGKLGLNTDFEYAMYNCESDSMVYGNYVSFNGDDKLSTMQYFPREKNMVYYFAIHFPEKKYSIYASLWVWIIFAVVMVFVLIIYSWSAFQLLQQKKYSALQKDFINNMTHEFKTPLSSILLSANFLSKQDTIREDEKMNKYAGLIIQQANKLNNHVEKVLGLAKTENDLFKMHVEEIDPALIITDIIENTRLKHPAADIGFMSVMLHPLIKADPFHFSNVVHNLLDNAVKYSDGTPHISVSLWEENKMLLLSVKDEGIGIAKKHLDNIFDRFYRIPGKQQNESTGFGLGLFYVKKICVAHGWKIAATSEEGKGTTITISIPK